MYVYIYKYVISSMFLNFVLYIQRHIHVLAYGHGRCPQTNDYLVCDFLPRMSFSLVGCLVNGHCLKKQTSIRGIPTWLTCCPDDEQMVDLFFIPTHPINIVMCIPTHAGQAS